jgi:hypothetical protein
MKSNMTREEFLFNEYFGTLKKSAANLGESPTYKGGYAAEPKLYRVGVPEQKFHSTESTGYHDTDEGRRSYGHCGMLPIDDPKEKADSMLHMVGERSAVKWAEEFCKRNPASDFGMMIAWFANAIEAGATDELKRSEKRLKEESKRKIMADLRHDASYQPYGYLSKPRRGC